MDDAPALRATELAALLGVAERRSRQVLGELEALGFALETGQYGSRLCPAGLAAAVKVARGEGCELASLRLDNSLKPYLTADRRDEAELDPLTLLIESRAEIVIAREVVGELLRALANGSQRLGFVEPTSWGFLGVPEVKRGM